MKAVLISIQPKWCELIASGKKTVEVRKTKPKLETPLYEMSFPWQACFGCFRQGGLYGLGKRAERKNASACGRGLECEG